MNSLTFGCIPKLFDKSRTPERGTVTLQITAMKPITVQGASRVRVKINDGAVECQMGMYVGPENEDLEQFCLIECSEWGVSDNVDKPKMIMQIETIKIVKSAKSIGNKKLGNPKSWKYGEKVPENISQKFPKAANTTKSNPGGIGDFKIENGRYMSIISLTPYMNKWTIKGRVTQKGEVRTWNNAKGSGSLFSFTICDESSDLKVTAFKEDCEKFFPMIEKGSVYQISNGSLKAKNRQYNSTQCDYELTLGRNTQLAKVECDDSDMPTQIYDFVKIGDIENWEPNSTIDVLAVVKHADDAASTILIKSQNREVSKRNMILVDESCKEVSCTLWGEDAETFLTENIGNIVAIKGARVGDFGGRSLSLSRNSDATYGYDDKDGLAETLKKWWLDDGKTKEFSSVTSSSQGSRQVNWQTLDAFTNPNQITDEKGIWFSSKAVVSFVKKENAAYKSCPGKGGDRCQKKLVDEGNGNYRCEKCNQTTPEFKWRMIINAQIADDTSGQFVSFFGEQGEKIMGMSENDFGELMSGQDEEEYEKVTKSATFQEMLFNCKAALNNYQDEQRIRITCAGIAPIDYKKYCTKLMEDIQSMTS